MTSRSVDPGPLFSVIIPAFNRADLLPRAILSVTEQSFREIELIVIDDGSTDDTNRVARSFTDPRIQVHRQANRGGALARNLGAEIATGEYLIFLDSDDEAISEWLETLAGLVKQPSVGIAFVGGSKSFPNGASEAIRPHLSVSVDSADPVLFQSGTFAVRRSLFFEVGGYRDRASHQQKDLARRVVPAGRHAGLRMVSTDRVLVRWHQHDAPRITTDLKAWYLGAVQTLDEDGPSLRRTAPREYAKYARVAGVSAARLGDIRSSRKYLRESLRWDRRNIRAYVRLLVAYAPPLARRIWPPSERD